MRVCRPQVISLFQFLEKWQPAMRQSRSGKERPEWSPTEYGRRAREPGSNGRKQNKRTKDRRTTRAVANKRSRPEDEISVASQCHISRAPHTRQRQIRCSDYGPNRRSTFPSYFFCGPCSIWDDLVTSGSVGQNKRGSARNECCAKHTNPCFPTQLKPGVIFGLNKRANILTTDNNSDVSSDDISVLSRNSQDSVNSNLPPQSPPQAPQQAISLFIANFRVEALQAQVLSLRSQLESAQASLRRERGPQNNNCEKVRRPKNMSDEAYARGLSDAIINLLVSIRTKKKRKQTSRTFFDWLNSDVWIRPALEE